MVDFADLIQLPTRASIKARVIAIAQALDPPLDVVAWVLGDPSERWIEISARVIDQFLSNITTQAVRAFFFDLSTDPGDPGDLALDQTPRPGWLSAFMAGWWGVQRGGATYATGSVLLTNAGSKPAVLHAFDLTFQRDTVAADGGYPTYRNTADAAIYAGLGDSLTLAPGASATIPIRAEQVGTYANASPAEISIVVNQSFGTLTVANASPVLGQDREERVRAIERARQQSAAASPNGPSDAYRYASTTGADGLPLQLHDGSGATTINRLYVSESSSTGLVLVYLANPTGAATTVEVSSANGNINGIEIVHSDGVTYNPHPIGVVPDTVTLGPTASDVTTEAPGPAAAVEFTIGPISGTARIKQAPGQAPLPLIAAAQNAIADALSLYFSVLPIGGLDQVAGAGVVYRSDIQDTVHDAYPPPVQGQYPAPLLYGVDITVPAASTTAISLGRVPTLIGPPTISAAADNGSTLVRLTVSDTSYLSSGDFVQIYDAVFASGVDWLTGTWEITVVNATHIDLIGSQYGIAVYGGGAKLSTIIITAVP